MMSLITTLSDADYAHAAVELECDPAAIRAFATVESGGVSGFLPDGRPKILFEAHSFYEITGGRFATAKDRYGVPLSSSFWNRALYGAPGTHQWERHDDAAALDSDAADESCSWGTFQIMGSNWKSLGYHSLEEFVFCMRSSAPAHLEAFVRFIKVNGLAAKLKSHNWVSLARGYNGSGQVSEYAEKLLHAYESAK